MRTPERRAPALRAFKRASGSAVGAAAASAEDMSHAIAISCRGTRCTPAMEACIRFWAARLDLAHGPIERCDVTIDLPDQPGRRRRKYHVGLAVTCDSGPPAVVDRREISGTHGDLFAAVHDAFTLAGRELAGRPAEAGVTGTRGEGGRRPAR